MDVPAPPIEAVELAAWGSPLRARGIKARAPIVPAMLAAPDTPWVRLRWSADRRRRWVLIALIASAVLHGGVGVGLLVLRHLAPETNTPPPETAVEMVFAPPPEPAAQPPATEQPATEAPPEQPPAVPPPPVEEPPPPPQETPPPEPPPEPPPLPEPPPPPMEVVPPPVVQPPPEIKPPPEVKPPPSPRPPPRPQPQRQAPARTQPQAAPSAPSSAAPAPAAPSAPPAVVAARPVGGEIRTPPYPPAALRRHEQGRVLVHVDVSASGAVTSITLAQSSGSPSLDEAAVNAVRQSRFIPKTLGGTPVAGSAEVPIVFRLE